MTPRQTFCLELTGLAERARTGKLYEGPDSGYLDRALARLSSETHAATISALVRWKASRGHLDWQAATWPTLGELNSYAAYLESKATTAPEVGADAACLQALAAAIASGVDQ